MVLFNRYDDDDLTPIKKIKIPSEKDLHELIKNNLENLLGVKLIATEFAFGHNRIDTLAFNEKKKIFVIIEYKIKMNSRLAKQIVSYMGSMHNNKDAFILAYNKKTEKVLKSSTVKWNDTKMIIIAPEFDQYLYDAVADPTKDIELWKINYYIDNIVELKMMDVIDDIIMEADLEISKPKRITKDKSVLKIVQATKNLRDQTQKLFINELMRVLPKNEQVFLKRHNRNAVALYGFIRYDILQLGKNIKIKKRQCGISFKTNHVFVSFKISKKTLIADLPLNYKHIKKLRIGNLNIKPIANVKNGITVTISDSREITQLLKLVKQSYKKTR